MKRILMLGAGKSAGDLIDYLCGLLPDRGWELELADMQTEFIDSVASANQGVKASEFAIGDDALLAKMVERADLVISMLPARFHPIVARQCLQSSKHLLTPSYVSREMQEMADAVEAKGLLFLNELGLDPGIDHMSAMKVIHGIQEKGGKLLEFESFTGGLIAPECDDNPWHYKFTWNPRNVVLAGQGEGGVKFLHNGRYKYIPYHQLFRRTEFIEIDSHGTFEGYANRDSLKYQEIYGLEKVRTMYRGTFRRPGFCKAWDMLVQIGATDDSYRMEHVADMTRRQYVNSFLKYRDGDSVELKLAYYLGIDVDSPEMEALAWLGLFEDEPVGLNEDASPARILQHILEGKWSMQPADKDMIVMWHKFVYEMNGSEHEIQSSLVVTGKDREHTAMSRTVGLPIGIAARHLLEGNIDLRGLQLPLEPGIYQPILAELENFGVRFEEKQVG